MKILHSSRYSGFLFVRISYLKNIECRMIRSLAHTTVGKEANQGRKNFEDRSATRDFFIKGSQFRSMLDRKAAPSRYRRRFNPVTRPMKNCYSDLRNSTLCSGHATRSLIRVVQTSLRFSFEQKSRTRVRDRAKKSGAERPSLFAKQRTVVSVHGFIVRKKKIK